MFLRVEGLHVKYGSIEVLHGIDLRVDYGEIITILGANGAGKSTTLMTISGLVKPSKGKIYYSSDEILLHKLPAHQIVKKGIAQVPEGRRIFDVLTVQENLNLGGYLNNDSDRTKKNRERVYELFPVLKERQQQLGGTLSGGEQQMLAIARALMAEPKILLLDEPSLGLAPILVKSIFQTIKEINDSGVTVILVEQNARMALKLADRGYLMETGKIVLENTSEALLVDPEVQNVYLGGKKDNPKV